MPLFQRDKQNLEIIKPQKFFNEKELQTLLENNLEVMFNCRFVATEYSTGPIHGGRIDSLALSEENNPVIIEYKVVESSQLVNQSLYYYNNPLFVSLFLESSKILNSLTYFLAHK